MIIIMVAIPWLLMLSIIRDVIIDSSRVIFLHINIGFFFVFQIANTGPQSSLDSTIDQGPFVSVAEDGMVAAMGNERKDDDTVEEVSEPQRSVHSEKTQMVSNTGLIDEQSTQQKSGFVPTIEQTSVQVTPVQDAKPVVATSSVKRCLDILRRQNRYSIWLLAYIAIITSCPFLGSALRVLTRKRLRNVLPAVLLRR